MQRRFRTERPNQLWEVDFTSVAIWVGMVFVVFVIDVFARRIGGCVESSVGSVGDSYDNALAGTIIKTQIIRRCGS